MIEDQPRYAIYFAPAASSALWQFGCGALGYDAESGEDVPFLPVIGIAMGQLANMTEEPRRYGFHGTLKAPFYLAEGAAEADLLRAAKRFAGGEAGALRIGLRVNLLGSFVALTPSEPAQAVNALAARCVNAFEPFRAPLNDADIARRKPETLTTLQRQNLLRFGYPFVFEDFRFHMTLTGALAESEREPVRQALTALFAQEVPHAAVPIDQIAIFRQVNRQTRFRLIARMPLGTA